MLVDTGAWYALADASDRHHQEASRFYSEHTGQTPLVTTDLIVAETWALLASHLGRPAALTFWDTLRTTRTPIFTLDPVDLEAAWHIAQVLPGSGVQLRGLHHVRPDGAARRARGLRL